MSAKHLKAAHSANKKGVECKYELLFSETRPPNFVRASREHTITLARSKSADRIYFRNEEARKATELAIRNGTLKFVTLSEDILAIESIDHAVGWPYREHARS